MQVPVKILSHLDHRWLLGDCEADLEENTKDLRDAKIVFAFRSITHEYMALTTVAT